MTVCAGAVVLYGKRVLLVRQALGHTLAGQWSIPWGIVKSEETPDVAAVRETHEEGGIIAEVDGLLGIQNLRQPGWLGIVFMCKHVNGVPVSDGGIETDQAAYFSLVEIECFDEPIEPWCKWLALRVLEGKHCRIPLEKNNPYQPRMAYL